MRLFFLSWILCVTFVFAEKLSYVEVFPKGITTTNKDYVKFTTIAYTEDRYALTPEGVSWNLSGRSGAQIEYGEFSSTRSGEFRVTASHNYKKTTVRIKVVATNEEADPDNLFNLEVYPRALTIRTEDSINFTAITQTSEGYTITPPDLEWTSTGGEIEDGNFYAETPGRYKVTAKFGTMEATAEVLVVDVEQDIRSLEIYPKRVVFANDEEITFKALGLDQFSQEIEINPRWSAKYGKIKRDGVYIPPKSKQKDTITVRDQISEMTEFKEIYVLSRKEIENPSKPYDMQIKSWNVQVFKHKSFFDVKCVVIGADVELLELRAFAIETQQTYIQTQRCRNRSMVHFYGSTNYPVGALEFRLLNKKDKMVFRYKRYYDYDEGDEKGDE